MKISTSKLVANRASAVKSTGACSVEGKRISSENAKRHGLSSVSGASLDFANPTLSEWVTEAKAFGCSPTEAEEPVTRLSAAREVIDAKHNCYKETHGAERFPDMAPEALLRTIKDMETSGSGVTSAERRAVFKLLDRQIKEDNGRARWFVNKLDNYRRFKRYDQRAVNQLRKAARIKKITKRTQKEASRDKGF